MLLGMIFLSALLVFVFMSSWFIVALYRRDNSIADIAWGIGFMLIALFTLFYAGSYNSRQLLITCLVLIWGTRLSLLIFLRNKGNGEDVRYKKWRDEWGKNFFIISFLRVFMLQGLAMLIISLPIIVVNSMPIQPDLGLLDICGVGIWIIGFIFETVADAQLYAFLKNPANKGKLLMTGPWQFSRHPNYFGEASMWWGLFIIAVSVPNGLATILSPLLITYLLRYVTGVPMTEKLMRNNPDFPAYQERTNVFWPWLPKK